VYSLAGSRLNITYMVENRGAGTMYFGIGGHPGFTLPFERGLAIEDYCLEFCEKGMPIRVGFSDACYRTGEDKPYPLHNGTELPLSHSLFDNDAIVLAGAARSVTLKSCKGTKAVRVEYPQDLVSLSEGGDYINEWAIEVMSKGY
jgi:galactose mutarotase-like enzyme